MTKQAQAKLSALAYTAIPLVALIATDLGVEDATFQHYLAAVVAALAIFGINVKTGDRTAAVGGPKAKLTSK